MTEPSGPTQDIEVSIPNEYFHTVLLQVLWHPDGIEATDEELLTKGVWTRGTGFYYRIGGVDFLVTARHIFSGRSWRENQPLTHSVSPTHVRMTVRSSPPPEGLQADQLGIFDMVLPLLDADENPLWLEHPDRGHLVDVAALPLLDNLPKDQMLFMPIEPEGPLEEPRFWVTQSVFIVGYPLGLDHGYLWPLWIRGSVASEPTIYFNYKDVEYPLFLVDARTRNGQSGSPVFMFRRHFVEDAHAPEGALSRTRFLGVYSGRTNDESENPPMPVDLGFVWHAGEVDRVCLGAKRGEKDAP